MGRAVDALIGPGADPRDVDFTEVVGQAVRGYARWVTHALGIAGESSYVDVGPPVGAYLALDGRLAGHPDRDVALLWNEEDGWSLAVETDGGEDPLVVARMGGEPVPPPHAVARWARAHVRDGEARRHLVA